METRRRSYDRRDQYETERKQLWSEGWVVAEERVVDIPPMGVWPPRVDGDLLIAPLGWLLKKVFRRSMGPGTEWHVTYTRDKAALP